LFLGLLYLTTHVYVHAHTRVSRPIEHYQPPPIARARRVNYKIHVNARSRCPINIRREAVFSRVPARRCFVKQIIGEKGKEEEERSSRSLEGTRDCGSIDRERTIESRSSSREAEELISNFGDGHTRRPSAEKINKEVSRGTTYSEAGPSP